MKTIAKTMPALLLALAACGDDGGGGGDDTQDPDASAADIQSVTCAGATIAATVTTDGFAFSPTQTTISTGDIVQFMPMATHDVASDDGLFSVGIGGNGCFQFNTAGTFQYRCTPHQFTGQIIVQ
jgi:plastocyanin